MINRSAVSVRPAQPYVRWAAGLGGSDSPPVTDETSTVYLLPECDDERQIWEHLRVHFDDIFSAELDAWHRFESDWPKGRTFEMFCQWFEIVVSSCVFDLCDDPIIED